jgi:transposase
VATGQDQATTPRPTLFLAFELGVTTWTLGFTTGAAPRPRERTMPAGALQVLHEELARAKPRFGWPHDTRVVRGDAAGRDGFWLPRGLEAQGVENCVVDSSSREVQRRHRRAKTARLDVHTRLTRLLGHVAGGQRVWSLVRVPRVEEADRRPRHRACATATRERTRVSTRLQGLRASPGLGRPQSRACRHPLAALRRWDGAPRPAGRRPRLGQAWEPVQAWAQRLAQVAAERRAGRQTRAEAVMKQVRQLLPLNGIGTKRAWGFGMACFGGRALRHGQAVGARSGLTPTPYASGNTAEARGLANAGHDHVRALAMAMAWGWRRFPPARALTPWEQQRFGPGSRRLRRIGMVALARTRLRALWRCVEGGILPDGAALNAAVHS